MSEELSNHDVQDGSKNCEFTEHLKESFQHANKISEEEKSDDHPPGEVTNTLFVKVGNYVFYNKAQKLDFTKPICTLLTVSSIFFKEKMVREMVSELSPANTSADKGDKPLELPYGTEVFVNDSEFDVGRSDSFCVAGYIPDKANQKRCLAIILESKTSNFYLVPIDSLRFDGVPQNKMDFLAENLPSFSSWLLSAKVEKNISLFLKKKTNTPQPPQFSKRAAAVRAKAQMSPAASPANKKQKSKHYNRKTDSNDKLFSVATVKGSSATCGCNCRKQVAELQKQLSETRAFCRELESELKTNLTKVNKKISALEASNKEHNSQRADDTNKKDSKPTVLTNSQPDLDARVQAIERSILNSALNLPLQQTMHSLPPPSALAIQQVQQPQLFPMQRLQYPMPQQQGVMATNPYLFFSP